MPTDPLRADARNEMPPKMPKSDSPFHREPSRDASTGVAYARNFPVGMSVGTADNALRKSPPQDVLAAKAATKGDQHNCKAKGLECESVIIMSCDKTFPDKPDARCLP
jgi:hypothetical protein